MINQVRLSDETVVQLEQRYRVPIRNGTYWYDKRSGAWGMPPVAIPAFSSTAGSCTGFGRSRLAAMGTGLPGAVLDGRGRKHREWKTDPCCGTWGRSYSPPTGKAVVPTAVTHGADPGSGVTATAAWSSMTPVRAPALPLRVLTCWCQLG